MPHPSALFTVSADTEAPVTTSDAKTSYIGPATIRLTATDNGSSGVKTDVLPFRRRPVLTGTTAVLPQPSSAVGDAHDPLLVGRPRRQRGGGEQRDLHGHDATASPRPPPATSCPRRSTTCGGKIVISVYPTDPSPSSGIAGVHVDSSNPSAWWGDYHEAGWNATAGAWQARHVGLLERHVPGHLVCTRQRRQRRDARRPPRSAVDADVPVTTCDAVYARTYPGPVTFTLSPSDAGGSGLAGTWWRARQRSMDDGHRRIGPGPGVGYRVPHHLLVLAGQRRQPG